MAGRYSDDEVEAIFRRALERQVAQQDGFARDELVDAAREVGLDEASVDRAIQELEAERGVEELYEQLKRRARDRWLRQLVSYLAIVGGLVGMHLLGFIGPWVAWVAFGWGVALAMQTFKAFRGPSEEEIEKERKRLNRQARREAQARAQREARKAKRRAKAEREAARQRQKDRHRQAGEELEQVIEEGVALLLSAAARKLREAQERDRTNPDSEFGRYVARQKGEAPAPSAPASPTARAAAPPRARVEVDEDEETEASEARARRRRERR